jgi:hypothetical protein
MNKYNNGKIYKLVCSDTNNIYIGSTIQPLNLRFNSHICRKDYASNFLSNPKIELLFNYPCESLLELRKKEREVIDNTECVNVKLPYVSEEERRLTKNKINAKTRSTDKYKEQKKRNNNILVKCPICDKEFKKSNLAYHKKTHN